MDAITLSAALNFLTRRKIQTYVLASNEWNKVSWHKYPIAIIQNDMPSTSAGYHWIAWYITEKNLVVSVEFFDSYGNSPGYYNLQVPFNKVNSENCLALQHDSSDICGLYALYFLYHRFQGYSYAKILEKFYPHKPLLNDIKIRKFYNSLCFCIPHRDARSRRFCQTSKRKCLFRK
jgi:hypothetical protein